MRWYWIDRFTEFESGKTATAIKNVTLAEEHLHDHFPGYPVVPNTLIVEGFAQCGGLLVGERTGYAANMILAKVPKAIFHFPARPGDTLHLRVDLDYISDEGALVKAAATIDGRIQTEAEVFFANVMEGPRARRLFSSRELVVMMHLLRAYEVGRAADGSPLRPPPGILEAAGMT